MNIKNIEENLMNAWMDSLGKCGDVQGIRVFKYMGQGLARSVLGDTSSVESGEMESRAAKLGFDAIDLVRP